MNKYELLTNKETHTKARHENQVPNMEEIAENFKSTNNNIFVV